MLFRGSFLSLAYLFCPLNAIYRFQYLFTAEKSVLNAEAEDQGKVLLDIILSFKKLVSQSEFIQGAR